MLRNTALAVLLGHATAAPTCADCDPATLVSFTDAGCSLPSAAGTPVTGADIDLLKAACTPAVEADLFGTCAEIALGAGAVGAGTHFKCTAAAAVTGPTVAEECAKCTAVTHWDTDKDVKTDTGAELTLPADLAAAQAACATLEMEDVTKLFDAE